MDSYRKVRTGCRYVQSEEPGEPEKPTHRKARLLPYVDADGTCRIGQTIEGLTGKASYSNGTYTITLTRKPEFKGNERPTSCDTPETYNLKVVSFNLEHFGKT